MTVDFVMLSFFICNFGSNIIKCENLLSKKSVDTCWKGKPNIYLEGLLSISIKADWVNGI